MGARVAPGSTPPDGVTTAGSVLHVQHVGEGTSGESDFDCTTEGPADADGVTFCPGQVLVGSSDSLVVTQVSAPEGLRVDPEPRTADPIPCREGEFCYGPDVVFDDPGVDAPTAVDDDVDATAGRSEDLDLTANDDLHGRDVTSLTTTTPAHGTVRVDGTTGSVRYAPGSGYTGTDTFTYTVVTAAGSTTATVTVLVRAAPSASSTASAGGGSSSDDPDGGATLAATGAPAGGAALGGLGVVLSGAGGLLLRLRRRRRPGTHV